MTRFTEKATAITPSRELQPDEYFNETDHLIYCSKCNTPRQCRHELQGKVLIPSIRCKCQQKIFEQEEAQRKLHEKQMEIEHLKTSGLQDKALYDYTFARDNGINPEIKLAHNYVSNWEEMKANASGLLIWGDVGTGKSFFAGCIANALLEKGVPVLMTNFSRILNTLTGMHFEDRNQFINRKTRGGVSSPPASSIYSWLFHTGKTPVACSKARALRDAPLSLRQALPKTSPGLCRQNRDAAQTPGGLPDE